MVLMANCTHCEAVFRLNQELLDNKTLPAEQYLCGNPYWALKYHMEEKHPEHMFFCGRQNEGVFGRTGKPEAYWEADGTCSFCGSISPKQLFDAIEQGAKIGCTDKNYKIYVDLPNPNPVERIISSQWAPEAPGDGWIEATPEVCEKYNWVPWGRVQRQGDKMWVQPGTDGVTKHAKFYFQHFNDEEAETFCQLLNDGKLNLGYPGHFYSRPYFMGYYGGKYFTKLSETDEIREFFNKQG